MVKIVSGAAASARAFGSVWEATPLFVLVGGVVTFATWRGAQTMLWEPSIKIAPGDRTQAIQQNEEKAAAWTASKQARGDWWHAMDTVNDKVFGEGSGVNTWAGEHRGTEASNADLAK